MSITTTNLIIKVIIVIWLLSLGRSIVIMFCGPLFKKASKGSKTAMYPILNLFGMLEVVELSPFLGILLFIPVFNLIVLFLMSLKLGKVFNASVGKKIGLILLPVVFYPLLAKSNVSYKVSNDEYFRALDSARGETVHLMTQEEIDIVNNTEDEQPENTVDSIFKSDVELIAAPEPYRAVRINQDDLQKMERTETIGFVDDLFRPIERTDNFEQLDTSENPVDTNQSKFTGELEREEKVEFFDL